jgi:hypothetical protein
MPAFLTLERLPPLKTHHTRSGKRCLDELDAFLLDDIGVEPDCTSQWQFVSGMDDSWWYEQTDEDKATKIHPYDSDCAAAPQEPEEFPGACAMADAGLLSIIDQAVHLRGIEYGNWSNQCLGGPRPDDDISFFDNLELTELQERASAR